jgi:glycosyltransferase involved in cell wall biosynthesis
MTFEVLTTAVSSPALLSVLVPVYNERAYLRRCIDRVLAAPLPAGLEREIVMVDDASKDGTTDLVREIASAHPGAVRAFYQERNQGKGAAIRRAIQEMRGQYAIFQDADLEYDPREYGRLLDPLLHGQADVVYGSRFASSPLRRVLNYRHSLGNFLLTHLSNFFTDLNLTDMETCYKAFRADVLQTIPLRSNRFGLEPEITAKVAKRGCIVYEVPISYHGRTYAEGKKIGWKDGLQALGTILKYWVLDDCYNERYGQSILGDLSHARRFNRWMVQSLEPYLGRRIIEVGSGIGNISRFLPKKEHLTVSDYDPMYLDMLNDAYRDNDLVDVARLDITSDADVAAIEERGANYDTIVCLNVLEHIENDTGALTRLQRLLSPGGALVLLVPQYPALYGSYDKSLGHYRRYTRADLAAKLAGAGYRLERMRSFNSLAALGWWVNSRLLGRQAMGRAQIKAFDLCVPLLRVVESVVPLPGLSLIAIARRP